MLAFDELHNFIQKQCINGEASVDLNATPKAVKISSADLLSVCNALHQHQVTYFDMLSCLTGIDNGSEAGTMEVVYNLYSIPFDHHLAIKVVVPRENPEVDSVTSIWKTADWHEREAFDMFGIKFKGHPDLRRILMPADWEGHPLKKDYKQQEYYRDIKLDY
jgi:NADH-quinone oxidoreductase subunit C